MLISNLNCFFYENGISPYTDDFAKEEWEIERPNFTKNNRKFSSREVDCIIGKDDIFFSKYDAVTNAKTKNIHLYYYDHLFSKVNWQEEPKETLSELYKKRAKQLRDSYDYLILFYSGGIDSTNILETFYYNNIHLDEIVMKGAFSRDKFIGDISMRNGEITLNCYPTLKKMNLNGTKITVFDDADYLEKLEFKATEDYLSQVGCGYFSLKEIPMLDVKKSIFSNLKTNKACKIFGIDKPEFRYDALTQKFFTFFKDVPLLSHGNNPMSYNIESDIKTEAFYYETENAEILRKQLHMIKKFYIKNVLIEGTMSHQTFAKNYAKIMLRLIYNLKNPLVFVEPKFKTKDYGIADCPKEKLYIIKNNYNELQNLAVQQQMFIEKNLNRKLTDTIITRKYTF